MKIIDDPLLAEIFATGGCASIPLAVVQGAHWLAHYLLAIRELTTIGHITELAKLGPSQFAAPISDGWAITFSWDYDANRAFGLRLTSFS